MKNEHNKYIYSVNDIYKIIFEFDDDFCIVRNSNYVDSYYTVIKFKKESELNISINEYWNENERKLKCKVDVCIYKTKQLIKKYNVDFTEFSIR